MILNDWHQRDVSFWHGDATCTPLMLGTLCCESKYRAIPVIKKKTHKLSKNCNER